MFSDFVSGISSYLTALKLIPKLRLWKYFLIPGLLSLLLGATIIGVAWSFAGNISVFLLQLYPFQFGLSFLTGLSNFVGGFLVLLIGLVIYKHLIMIISSPFMGPLSQKVEEHLTGGLKTNTSNFASSIWRGIRISLRNILRELVFVIFLFPLSFIPVIGIGFTVLLFLIQSFYAGFSNWDYSLERHFNYSKSVGFIKEHRSMVTGNGLVFMLLLMLGIGFLFAPPLATIAATISHSKRIAGKELV